MIAVLIMTPFVLCQAQKQWGITYAHGYNIPAYSESPTTERTSPFISIFHRVKTLGDSSILGQYYGGPDLNLHAFYQNLGNDQVMGHALGFVPELRFQVGRKRTSRWYGGIGLGIGWVNRPWDKVDNPLNTALGTPWNIYAQAGIEYQYPVNEDWLLHFEFAMHHMSNSFFSFPNLGVNLPSLGVGLTYQTEDKNRSSRLKEDRVVAKTGIRPFFRLIYGITERGFDGPKFGVYGGGIGIRKAFRPHRTVLLGAEYMFDESNYFFVSRASGSESRGREKARRYLVFLGHEYHFGYMSFVTEAGIYLSDQFNKQSIFSTKAGFQFFPLHQFYRKKHQFSIGVYIRAYGLRADFFEINANYRI